MYIYGVHVEEVEKRVGWSREKNRKKKGSTVSFFLFHFICGWVVARPTTMISGFPTSPSPLFDENKFLNESERENKDGYFVKVFFFVYYCCLIWCSTNKLFFIYIASFWEKKKTEIFFFMSFDERGKKRRTTTTTTIDRHRINSNVFMVLYCCCCSWHQVSKKKVVKVVFYFFEFHSSPCFVKELQCVWIRMRMNERMKSSIWSNKMLRSKMI